MDPTDTELVSQSLAGSREAFGRIVEQYQSLICSLAYSTTGSLTQSEDLAQETFVIAWKQLRQLREPAKLRSWLCSIARSVISGATRRQTREPAHGAETLDAIQESVAQGPIPSEHVVNREEEAILWRSLEQIPDLYREPLVLFYREQQSVASVAEQLELSEDAVKQRLSRGRKLLTEEVTAFVEGTLARTNSGKAFTLGVLEALPVVGTSVKMAGIGATAKGSATVKAAAGAGLLGVFFAPVIGILAGVLGTKISIESAQSPRERQFRIKMAWINWSLVLAFNILFFAMIFVVARSYWKAHSVLFTWAIIGVAFSYGLLVVWLAVWTSGRQRRIGLEEAAGSRPMARLHEYRSRGTLLGWPLIHIRLGGAAEERRAAKGWIAFGNVAHGILFASGGVATGLVSVGGIALGGVAIGGCAVGLLTCGGMVFGILAVGGVAVGYMACGTAAIGWLAACGGAAAAHDFALGGMAVAQYANDETARAMARDNVFLSHAYRFMNFAILFNCLLLVPGFLYWRKHIRQPKAGE